MMKEPAKADTGCAPPVNEIREPMVLAAEVAMRVLIILKGSLFL